ncbi:YqaJ viral recombinase family protein [Aerococcaceae bacterium zg-ZJ1578]|uniref:YqaJ viral recombinase family protein n=1 Tax=Aerococcaceae bacterium zg-252 TaxID=2796928 RepID=UPI001A1C9A93|nr:YqaJ viral recombinase family protein [Aerococcaceae bacterium zg-1578]
MKSYQIASNHAEWLTIRSKGIGGSDVGTLLGLNPFKSKYQLWLEKTGQLEASDISSNVAVQIGNELENLVARLFMQETGLQVQKDNKTYFPEFQYQVSQYMSSQKESYSQIFF